MNKTNKRLVKDIILVINEFLNEEINLNDVKQWLKNHPCSKKGICSKDDKSILGKLEDLTIKSVNVHEWEKLKVELTSYGNNKKPN